MRKRCFLLLLFLLSCSSALWGGEAAAPDVSSKPGQGSSDSGWPQVEAFYRALQKNITSIPTRELYQYAMQAYNAKGYTYADRLFEVLYKREPENALMLAGYRDNCRMSGMFERALQLNGVLIGMKQEAVAGKRQINYLCDVPSLLHLQACLFLCRGDFAQAKKCSEEAKAGALALYSPELVARSGTGQLAAGLQAVASLEELAKNERFLELLRFDPDFSAILGKYCAWSW